MKGAEFSVARLLQERGQADESADDVVRRIAAETVAFAASMGWTGPAFCPRQLASLLGIKVEDREVLSGEAQLTPTTEVITEKWLDSQRAYEDFRLSVRRFQRDWDNLLTLQSIPKVVAELERLFGESGPESLVKLAADEFFAESVGRNRSKGRSSFAVGTGATVPFVNKPAPTNKFFGDDA